MKRAMAAFPWVPPAKVPSITFKGPKGWKYSRRVADKDALEKVKVGDQVDFTWTGAVTLEVTTPKEWPAMKSPWIIVAAVLLAGAAAADEVFLKGGGRLSGRILSRGETTIEVDVGAGRIGVPASSVLRIEEGRSPLHEYEERAGRLAPGDVEGWVALGEWASAKGLGTQAREAYHRARAASPDDPRANEALGNVLLNGRWVSEEESYRARGYVQWETLPGGPAHRLKVTLKSGAASHVWIDAASGLVGRTLASRAVRGREVALETTFGDYRETGGVLFPRLVETGVPGRPRRLRIVVESVEVNVPLDEDRFGMPR
jgi:hypothetical protein